jgi:adenine-specific DNA-methyltransferase
MANFFDTLTEVLKADDRFFSTDGTLLRNKVYECAMTMDAALIGLLLGNADTKKRFFTEVNGVLVFDKIGFGWVVNNRKFLPDSHTRFKNRIGLTDERGDFISASGDVTLSFPYKDCVLEGGQTKDDQKRDEIFYNATLAPDEVDRLLYPKALVGARRYSAGGTEVDGVTFREGDNLVIKGNNLLAIASLLKRYEGKIKCVYIDPPYNTGNDSFGYNDSFNRSSWLTFMKNRLEIARRLLHNDGFIFVQCDDYQSAYLKILMDEIFRGDNYRNSIYWHRTYAGKTVTKKLPWNTDTILMYSKNPSTLLLPTTAELNEADIRSYNKDDNDGRGKYNTVSLQKTSGPGPETTYDYIDNNGKIWPCPKKGWRMKQSKLKALENDNRLYIAETTMREKYYLSERLKIGKQIDNFWGDVGNMNRVNDEIFDLDGQKPEKLIERLISLAAGKGDIVLDFFAGTGTTGAVAHKMGRQYILVEQMDYIHELTETRLKKVIAGEQGGISETVKWQGGGSFVYCELAKVNQRFVDEAISASTDSALSSLLSRVLSTAFIGHRVNPADISASAADFEALSLNDKKRFIIELLDKNMLYVNLCDLDDEEYGISEADRAFTRSFYGLDRREGER